MGKIFEIFLFALNAVLPIVILIAVGYFLKKIKLVNADFLKMANKLCFKVFLPVMLFLNIYGIESLSSFDYKVPLFCVGGILLTFGIGLIAARLFIPETRQKGVVVQCVMRSNYAIIGIPLAFMLFGPEGEAVASLLAAFSIPTFNILAVIALSLYDKEESHNEHIKKVAKGIAKNPLIIGVLLGLVVLLIRMLFVKLNWSFRLTDISFLYTSLNYLGRVTTPLALIVLGGQFEFVSFKTYKKQITIATVFRLVVVPIVLLSLATLVFKFRGAPVAAFVALFSTPVAVSSAVMAQEMNGDGELACSLVVSTTIFSSITLVIIISILKYFAFL